MILAEALANELRTKKISRDAARTGPLFAHSEPGRQQEGGAGSEFRANRNRAKNKRSAGGVGLSTPTREGNMAAAQYFVERVTAHNDVWMIKLDDEEYGPYKSQSEAVLFAIDAAEKLNEDGEKAQIVIIAPTWTYEQDISRGSW